MKEEKKALEFMRKYTGMPDTGYRMQDAGSKIQDTGPSCILDLGSVFFNPDHRQRFLPYHIIQLHQVFFHDLFQFVQLCIGLCR